MDSIINPEILKNPLNWISIGSMILLSGLMFLVVYSHATTVQQLEAAYDKDL